jgi:hypothetical protein
MRRWLVWTLMLGCNPTSVGRPCVDPGLHDTKAGTQIVAPALECPSRLCLIQPTAPDADISARALCTASCESDDDCDAAPTATCPSGFACAVPLTVGELCCKRLCTCRDGLDAASPRMPASCDPAQDPSAPARCRNVPAI